MAQVCHTCRYATAVVHCVTETVNFCFTCDYLRHCNNCNVGHVRYQICDNCMMNPALLLCNEDGKALCQSCYTRHYNCTIKGHRIQIVNSFPLLYHHNNNNQHHAHMPHAVHYNYNYNNNQQHHVGGHQRRAGMFEMSCDGNNNCERWMFPMGCESCLASNVVVYCPGHDKLLCDNCDQINHLQHDVVPPHLRCILCVTYKRLTRNFRVGTLQYIFPPAHPPAAEEVSMSTYIGLDQRDIDFFHDRDDFDEDDFDDDDFFWFSE